MNTFLIIYLLKVALIITIFFAFYRLIFKNFHFFQANRFYLLYTTIIAFTVPLINISWSIGPADNITPVLHSLKPQGIPEKYHLTYQEGIVSDPELLTKLANNLTEGDFLDIHSIKPTNGEKGISIYLKSL